MKRTLMWENQELLEFEVDLDTGRTRILDGPSADDALLSSLGFGGLGREAFVANTISCRALSRNRVDLDSILGAFGACSPIELAFRGHGLSLTDHLWYRTPGSTERWEDINFFDNGWDGSFGESILKCDYRHLATCSLETPDVTTVGHLRKAWEHTENEICLIKEPLFEGGVDLEGALLASELCRLLYGQDAYQPLDIVERYGRRFSSSPLMISRDEELVQGYRLFAMGGFDVDKAHELMGPVAPQAYIEALSRAGAENASASVAKIFAFKGLALLADIHAGNFGIIRNTETGACQVAPPFDYDRAFGFPYEDFPYERMNETPVLAAILCCNAFSDLDSSWDWTWYEPRALDGFENRIAEAYRTHRNLPPNLEDLIVPLFVMQRAYVNETASAGVHRRP